MPRHDKECELVTLSVPSPVCKCQQRALEDMVRKLQGALDTADVGDNLVGVAKDAHLAELERIPEDDKREALLELLRQADFHTEGEVKMPAKAFEDFIRSIFNVEFQHCNTIEEALSALRGI